MRSGAGIAHSQGIPPNFYPPHMNVGPLVLPPPLVPHCISLPLCPFLSPPLLPVWMNVASLNSWLLDFHTVWFSESSGCSLFWGLVVILSVVARRGQTCLATPPCWLEVWFHIFLQRNNQVLYGFKKGRYTWVDEAVFCCYWSTAVLLL